MELTVQPVSPVMDITRHVLKVLGIEGINSLSRGKYTWRGI